MAIYYKGVKGKVYTNKYGEEYNVYEGVDYGKIAEEYIKERDLDRANDFNPFDWFGRHGEESIFKSEEENAAIRKDRRDYTERKAREQIDAAEKNRKRLEKEEFNSNYESEGREEEIKETRREQDAIDGKNQGRTRDETNKYQQIIRQATRYNVQLENRLSLLEQLINKSNEYTNPSTIQTRHIDRQSKTYNRTTLRDRGIAGVL